MNNIADHTNNLFVPAKTSVWSAMGGGRVAAEHGTLRKRV